MARTCRKLPHGQLVQNTHDRMLQACRPEPRRRLPARDARNSRPKRCRSNVECLRSSPAKGCSRTAKRRLPRRILAPPKRRSDRRCSLHSPVDWRRLTTPDRSTPSRTHISSIAWHLLLQLASPYCFRTPCRFRNMLLLQTTGCPACPKLTANPKTLGRAVAQTLPTQDIPTPAMEGRRIATADMRNFRKILRRRQLH